MSTVSFRAAQTAGNPHLQARREIGTDPSPSARLRMTAEAAP